MAEVVYQNLEGMLPELEDLEHQGVFSEDELRVIIKRRTDFEYKLQKRVLSKQDVINYIEYELKLNSLRVKRCKRMKLKSNSTSAFSITKKIHALFRKALMKFSDDLDLWKQYIEFCKNVGSTVAISKAFGKLLQQHSQNPDVWLMAAKYEYEIDNNAETARSILLRGLRHNRESKQLWHEYFRLELLHVDKIKQRKKLLGLDGIELMSEKEDEPQKIDEFLRNKTAEIVFNKAIDTIKDDIDFRFGFLDISQVFEDTDSLTELILKSISKDYPDHEKYLTYICCQPVEILRKDINRIIRDDEWIDKEMESKNFFLEKFNETSNTHLLEQCVHLFFTLLRESKTSDQADRRLTVILDILRDAESKETVTEPMYVLWSELLEKLQNTTDQHICLQNALKSFPKSTILWKKYLLLKATNAESWYEIKEEFRKCFKKLIQNADIWEMFIDISHNASVDEQDKVLKEALSTSMRRKFLLPYLRFLQATKDKNDVRQFYQGLLREKLDASFILECITYEKSQESKSKEEVRRLFEKLIEDYGAENIEYWLSYISYERSTNESTNDVAKLHAKALRTLKSNLVEQFTSEFTLITTS